MEFEKALPSSFLLLTHIAAWDAKSITAEANLTDAPAWLLFEACAQASAMHQRLVTDFRDHAFLLSADSVPLDTPAVSGTRAALKGVRTALPSIRRQRSLRERKSCAPGESL